MLIRQTIAYLPAQTLGPLLQLISVLIWTHFLTPTELGAFALLTAWYELAYTASLLWFSLYCLRYYNGVADRAVFLNTESAILIVAGLIGIAASLTLPYWLEAEWSALLLTAAVVLTFLRIIATHLGDRARASQDILSYTLLQGVWPIAGLALGLVLVNLMADALTAVVLGYAIAQAIALLPALLRLGVGAAPFSASKDLLKAALRFGLPLLASGVLIWIATHGIRFIIAGLEGAAAVGLITVGLTIGIRIAGFAAMLVTAAAFPLAIKLTDDFGVQAGQAQLLRNGLLLLAVLLPAAAGILAIADPFITLFVAEPFQAASIIILPIAAIASVARNIRIHSTDQVFLLHERPLMPLATSLLDAALTVIFVVIGYYTYGLTGAIAGAGIGAVGALTVSIALGFSLYRYIMPGADVARIAAAAGIMWALLIYALPTATTGVMLAGTILAGSFIYVAALAILFPKRTQEVASEISRWPRQRSNLNNPEKSSGGDDA